MYDEMLEAFIILLGVWASNLGRESASRAGGCVAGTSGLRARGVFGLHMFALRGWAGIRWLLFEEFFGAFRL